MKDYYKILGVNENANQDEIKKTYRLLSKQYHPDVNPEGSEKFKEISEAYDVLGNVDKKNNYDNQKNNPFNDFINDDFNIHDIFSNMMNRQQKYKAPDKIINLNINTIESYFGVKKEFKYDYFDNCNNCSGSGGDRKICDTCKGQGFISQKIGNSMFQQIINSQCNKCNGNGSIITKSCNKCKGDGLVNRIEEISVNIPKNVDNGDFLRLQNKGDYNQKIKNRGDLILKINLNNINNFEKSGKNLIYYKKLTTIDLIINDKINIPHPEGDISINIPNNLNTDNPLKINNKGFKDESLNGDFFIKISVTNDNKIDKNIKQKIRELLNVV